MPKENCSVDMTMCPDCVQYVRHCVGHSTVECPFCETSFSPQDIEGTRPSASAIPAGLKTGVMAASFVGATMLGGVACGASDQPEYGAPVPDDAGFNSINQSQDAGDEDTNSSSNTSPNYANIQPEYGVAMPEDAGSYEDPDAEQEDDDVASD